MAEESDQTRRVFELYLDSLEGERDIADELLLVHLRYFGEDIESVTERLKENPRLALSLVQQLSRLMQILDARAGGVQALTDELKSAKRWALLLPEDGTIPRERGER